MIDVNGSRSIAQAALPTRVEVELDPRGPLHVDDDYVLWAYNTPAARAGDPFASLAGNGPMAIDRETGEVHHLTSARPWEESLEELRGERGA